MIILIKSDFIQNCIKNLLKIKHFFEIAIGFVIRFFKLDLIISGKIQLVKFTNGIPLVSSIRNVTEYQN